MRFLCYFLFLSFHQYLFFSSLFFLGGGGGGGGEGHLIGNKNDKIQIIPVRMKREPENRNSVT